ncbi:hypothetical protein JCM8547_004298 [Rhodosporidiobolus lusitaniae]
MSATSPRIATASSSSTAAPPPHPHQQSSAANSSATSPPSRRDSFAPAVGTGGGPPQVDRRRTSAGTKTARARGGDGDEDDDGEPRTKKGRLVLSCTECKRRKVKCDRKIPCSACILRGQPDGCVWDKEGAINPENQPFALASQYTDVCARLSAIEAYLETLPDDLRAAAPQPPRAPPVEDRLPRAPPSRDEPRVEVDHQRLGITSEMENAARELENTTFINLNETTTDSPSSDFIPTPASYNAPSTARRFPEPTSAATSILAGPRVFSGPTSAVSLGLDFCLSQEEMDQQYRHALNRVCTLLPSEEISRFLVDKYVEEVAWFISILHLPAFLAEHDRFMRMLQEGRQDEVDPAWLAIYFMVLALGLDSLASLSPSHNLPYTNHTERCRDWYAAALRLLQLSDPTRRPQFRIVQLTLLFGQWSFASAIGDDRGAFLSLLAAGVRVAQKLRLHLLGDDSSVMPPDDPALPPGQNSVKRQTALRVFGLLCFFDTVTANGRLGAYLIHNEQVTSAPLANISSNQLSNTDWRINPSPRSVWTEASLEYAKLRGGHYMKLMFDRLVTHGRSFTYETVLELDRELKNQLDEFPAGLASENTRAEAANPLLRKQRYFAISGLHSRVVRLHRPYSLLGFTNPKFRYSTETALKSARACITAHHNGRDLLGHIRMIYSHTLSSTIVLAANLFHLVDTDAPAAAIDTEQDFLAMALEIFEGTIPPSPVFANILANGAGIISMLRSSAEQRRQERVAGGRLYGPPPTFTQILRDIAKALHLAQSPAPAAPQFPQQPLIAVPTSFQQPQHQVAPSPYSQPQHPFGFSPTEPQPFFQSYQPAQPLPPVPPEVSAAYSARLLTDMGLSTFASASAGAFDSSWYTPASSHIPPGPHYDSAMGPPPPTASSWAGGDGMVHPHQQQQQQYVAEPAWLTDGQAGARALLEQISGP